MSERILTPEQVAQIEQDVRYLPPWEWVPSLRAAWAERDALREVAEAARELVSSSGYFSTVSVVGPTKELAFAPSESMRHLRAALARLDADPDLANPPDYGAIPLACERARTED